MRRRAALVSALIALGACSASGALPAVDGGDARTAADAPTVTTDAPKAAADGPKAGADGPKAGADAPPAVIDAPPAGSDGGVRAGPGIRATAANTGVPPGVALTEIDGDVVVTAADTSIDAKDIHGFLTIRADRVHVTRSIVRGRATDGNASVISVQSGADVLIEDTEVAVAFPSAGVDGFGGSGFVARRLNIHGGVDGMKAGSLSTIEYSYIHDLMSFDHDPNQGGGPTHNDAIQILEGTTIHITGNSLIAAMSQNSAIQITEDFGTVTDVHIDANFADGGGCTFNFSHKGAASLDGLTTTGNRFGRSSFFNCPILESTQTHLVSTGDVWDDDGTPVPIQTHD